jgi:hypothetical protein
MSEKTLVTMQMTYIGKEVRLKKDDTGKLSEEERQYYIAKFADNNDQIFNIFIPKAHKGLIDGLSKYKPYKVSFEVKCFNGEAKLSFDGIFLEGKK